MDNSTGACSALFSCLQEDAVSTLPSVIASGTDHLLSRVDLILGGSTQLLSPIPLMHLTYPNLLHAAVWYSAHECLVHLLQDGFLRDLDKPSGEGLTPLHLAAAVGDFVAVNHLLEAGASVEIFDNEGRTPLHYAIGTDMRVVVQLCSRNASCLQIPDHYNKTPYNLATEYQDTLAAHFFITLTKANRGLLSHAEISMEARMMSMKSNLKEGSLWIPFNLKAPICVKPARDLYGGNVFCACNLPVSEHEPLSRNTTLLQRFAKYKSRFVLGPTNTFGEIEHAANNFVSPYVRISDTVEISKLSHLFETVWSMERPQLVLSFYGDEVNSTQLKESIRKLIWKISGSTITWIITDGMQQSISPVVSEAIKQYIEAYGEGLVEALGVVHWRRACALEGLTSPEYTGCYPARCTAMKETSALHGDLDTNMTHYLFVDSGECTLDQPTLEFRSKLEAFLHNWSCSDHLDDVNMLKQVQTCGILSGGNENTLNAIHSLVKDNMPIILLKNSGGLADILIVCLEDTEVGQRNLHKRAVTEGSRDSEIFRLSPANIRQAVLTYWERMEKPDIVVLLIQELLESSKMLCIYDAEEDELDYHVLLLLLGPTEDAATANVEAQFSKLEIAIALNRSDVAREKVFLDGLKWDNDRLGSYMTSFLLQENVEFTKLFLEKGFDLKAYVTCETMERLYTYSVRRATQRRALVNVIRHLVKLPERINLLLIGKVLTLLMGNRYFPVYLEPNFAKTVETEKQEKMPNCPATHLFIWALLTERNEAAAFFWTQTQEPLGAALMAACLLRRFARFADSLVNREELIEFSNSYEDKAHGLLTECYSQDPANTSELLIRERPLFGQVSCIMLASDGNSMSFISHRCSEQFLERTWCGAIDQHARRFTFFISLITGIVMPPLVPFTIKFNLEATKQPIEKNGKDAKAGTLSRMAKNSKLLIDDDLTTEAESPKEKCRNYLRKIYAFYYSPSVRFSYATLAHILFLCFFVYVLLFNTARQSNYDLTANMILMIWVVSFFIENVRQGFTSGLSFRAYIKRIWKSLELIAVALYILGTALHLMLVAESAIHYREMPIDPVETVQETLLRMADVFYGLSLFLFFFRLLEAFTADITIGPLVIMVQTMVVKDLLPFLALFVVCLFSFAVLQWVIAFKHTASHSHLQNLRTLFDALQMAYFQIFGEYSLEELTEKKRPECTENNINCHDELSPWFSPILLGVFVILTQVLLLNLLVAMFASTYVRIEAASTGYWALQRYHLICEFVQRSPLPPPLILFWHLYLLIKYLVRRCRREHDLNYHPFKRSYIYQPSRERQLIHWERLRFWDYQRYVLQGRTRRKKQNQKSINVRTTVLTGQSSNPLNAQLNVALENFQSSVNQNMREILSRTNRVEELDRKVDHIIKILKGMHDELAVLHRQPVTFQSQLQRTPVEKTDTAKVFRLGSITQRPVARVSTTPQPSPARMEHVGLLGFPLTPVSETESTQSEVQKLNVYEGNQHMIAMFSPPTADSTPSLYATPLPWDSEKSEGEALGWRPSPFPVHDWNESDDFEEAMRTRRWNPMGTAYQPAQDNPSPDPIRGIPRNPTGRTGVGGKGRLPVWGANPSVIIVLTREQKPKEKSARRTFVWPSDRPRLEYALIVHRVAFQLPWFLVRHPSTCNGLDCTKSLVDLFVNKRIEELCQTQPSNRESYEKTVKAYHEAHFQQVWSGYLNDMINTDNAWIEPIVVNVHFQPGETEQTEILRIFSWGNSIMEWVGEHEKVINMRESHRTVVQMTLKKLRESRSS